MLFRIASVVFEHVPFFLLSNAQHLRGSCIINIVCALSVIVGCMLWRRMFRDHCCGRRIMLPSAGHLCVVSGVFPDAFEFGVN
jgi:hypothetical protein